MASENSDSEDRMEASHGPRECMACRGSGRVISNLGGATDTVPCPWCRGTGERIADVDAQERWLAAREGADTAPAAEPAASDPASEGTPEDAA